MHTTLTVSVLASFALHACARTAPARLDLFVNSPIPLSHDDAIDQFADLLDPATILSVHDRASNVRALAG